MGFSIYTFKMQAHQYANNKIKNTEKGNVA